VAVIYLKSFLWGAVGAVIAAVLWYTVAFILPLFGPYLVSRFRGTGGMSSGRITSDSIMLAAVVGFLVAFAWAWHQLRTA